MLIKIFMKLYKIKYELINIDFQKYMYHKFKLIFYKL
jgi:hypothetical protein